MKRLTSIAATLLLAVAPMLADRLDNLYILGGELSNSAATSVTDVDEVMPRMAALGLNTVLVPAYWEFLEPVEGQFDFTLVDRVIDRARENHLQVVFLWFGAWKNSMSCYAPLWFKTDTKRFPRAQTRSGKPLEIASCFSESVFEADNRAFCQLVRHIKETDSQQRTVVMLQVENEIGMLEDARDHSPLAEKAYRQWGEKRDGSLADDERFMAAHYARYVERLAKNARQIYDLPLYVNAAMNSRGRKPGEYPSAGPLAHLADLWKKHAPSIDLLAPDIYDTGFKSWAAQYAMPNNRLFIPESRCCENSGVRALYVFGEYRALGFSPFAIDQAPADETRHVTQAYGLLGQLKPVLQDKKARSWGLLFDQEDRERLIEDGDLLLTCRHNFTLPWDPRATNGSTWPEGGGVVVRLDRNEYLVAGSGIVVSFQTKTEAAQAEQKKLGEDGFAEAGRDAQAEAVVAPFKGRRVGIGFADEVEVLPDGQFRFVRRDNGDQDHQGRHVRISVGDYRILHVKLYEY